MKCETQTLFAHVNPQALHKDFGPLGPRRIIGVESLLIPQCWQLTTAYKIKEFTKKTCSYCAHIDGYDVDAKCKELKKTCSYCTGIGR